MTTDKAELQSEFEDSPQGWAKRWEMEFTAARKSLEAWHIQGDKIVKRFLDKRETSKESSTRLNLFTANVQTLRALLYGKTPQVDVSRRFGDAQDDEARVAAEMLERLLNADIERDSDSYAIALQYALDDRLLAGLGNVRVRYEVEMETVPGQPALMAPHPEIPGQQIELAPEVPETEKKSYECVETDYIYWKDQLWGPARTFQEVPWWAFRVQMTRDELVKRFGEEIGEAVPLNTTKREDKDDGKTDPWDRSDVWEIWHKETERVFWFVEGYHQTLDDKEDPLELEGFWPFPRPMVANLTTTGLVPRPDFVIAQDLYDEIDLVSTRITLLEKAIKVAGVYDQTADGVKRLLSETTGNELLPVPNWGGFAEKGGIKGAIDWLPLDMIVSAMDKLREYRTELMGLLFQVTGMSDIMRGQAATQSTATEQAIKAKFAGVRVQAMQDEFARFASDVMKLKGEIICRWFDAETIVQQSNVMRTPDAQLAQAAVQLLKSDFAGYRIQVKPEAISMTDYAALKQEKTELVVGLSTYFQGMMPLMQMVPGSITFILQLGQWMVAGLKGASTIEGVFDAAIAQATQAAQQPQQPQQQKPDPRMQTEMFKAKAQLEHQNQAHAQDMQRISVETQADIAKHQSQAITNVREVEATERIKAMHAVNQLIPGVPGGAS